MCVCVCVCVCVCLEYDDGLFMDAEKEKTAICLTAATNDRYSGVQVGKWQTDLGSGNQMPAENV